MSATATAPERLTTLEDLATIWRAGMESAAEHFAHANLSYYCALADKAFAAYKGEVGGFERCMLALTRDAAAAHGYPSFHHWLEQQAAPSTPSASGNASPSPSAQAAA